MRTKTKESQFNHLNPNKPQTIKRVREELLIFGADVTQMLNALFANVKAPKRGLLTSLQYIFSNHFETSTSFFHQINNMRCSSNNMRPFKTSVFSSQQCFRNNITFQEHIFNSFIFSIHLVSPLEEAFWRSAWKTLFPPDKYIDCLPYCSCK